ncbi:hypothetical protein AB1N83_014400, partial [Pleurotus pulmonarius]
PILWIWSKT